MELKPGLCIEFLSMNNFTYSLNKYLLCIYYVPGSILGIGDIATSKYRQSPSSHGVYVIEKEMDNKQKIYVSVI